jgi:hypothetical protein
LQEKSSTSSCFDSYYILLSDVKTAKFFPGTFITSGIFFYYSYPFIKFYAKGQTKLKTKSGFAL